MDGYSLFYDIKDSELQSRNRAVTLFNIFDDNRKGKKVHMRVAGEMVAYLEAIPPQDRAVVLKKLTDMLEEGGHA